ncbi:MAG: type III secretion system export apparatus subunit SctU [Pseudomonadota bacterium]
MSEKTEQPTAKRLRDVRKKGQVAKSKEVVSAALIIVLFGTLVALIGLMLDEIASMVLAPRSWHGRPFEEALEAVVNSVVITAALVVAPIIAVAMVTAIAAHLAQFGFLLSAQALQPKLSNLSPASGVKKIFNKKNLFEFLKSIIKICFLGILLFLLIRDSIQDLTRLPHCGKACIPVLLGDLIIKVMIYTAAAYTMIAFADFIFQRWQFTQENKMTKDEVKREYKESEGDPHVKGHRRQLARELTQGDMDQAVRKSRAVVTNPVHLAVALQYREGKTPLPIIAAKGQRLVAQRIVKVAVEAGVPVIENIPVARGLYETGNVKEFIPSEMLEGVVEVLKIVLELEKKRNQ